MVRSPAVSAAILAAIVFSGCSSTPPETLTSTDWLRENSSVLRDLESFEKGRQQQAVARLKRLGPDRGSAVAISLLADSQVDYRGEVLLARLLADWRDVRGVGYLLKYLRHEDQGAMEIASQGLLAFKGNRAVIRALLEMLESPSANQRQAAAGVLSEMRSEEMLKLFPKLYPKESEKMVRGIFVRTVLSSKHSRRDEFLVEALMDTEQAIREMAWGALKKRPRLPEVRYDPAATEVARARAVDSLRRWLGGNG
ncbi:MAG: HEAT repeat domain-containing protein [Planctomycetota bacterium]|nr:hypothetical protein [Planctomycetota bacterium]MEE3053394.1 HEAT repeat domain-containing protein [Planctomycetota bacterium]